MPRRVKFIEGGMVVARSWGSGEMESFSKGHRVSVLQDKESSGAWAHSIVNVLSTSELSA